MATPQAAAIRLDDAAIFIEINATDGDAGIRRAARRVLPDDGSQILLVIDQFEELFTQVDADTANRFVDAIRQKSVLGHNRS